MTKAVQTVTYLFYFLRSTNVQRFLCLPFPSLAVTLAHCAFIFLFCHFFNPPFPPTCFIFPGHFLHGSVVSLFLQWIGFQLLSRAQRLLSPGFCHLYKTHCHFHSTSPSFPFYPLLLALCFYLLQGRVGCVCACVCNSDSLQPNWTVAAFKHYRNNFSQHQRFLSLLPTPFYFSPFCSPPFPFSLHLLPFTSCLLCQLISPTAHLSCKLWKNVSCECNDYVA